MLRLPSNGLKTKPLEVESSQRGLSPAEQVWYPLRATLMGESSGVAIRAGLVALESSCSGTPLTISVR